MLLILIAVVWEWVYVKSTTMKEVFILPKGFKGVVLIAYEQKNGMDAIKNDHKLVYRIPKNGVLKLKGQPSISLTQSWFYFENELGERTEFYYSFDPNEMKRNPDKIYAYGRSYREFENDGEKVKFDIFFIGYERDRDSLSRVDEKMNPIKILKDK